MGRAPWKGWSKKKSKTCKECISKQKKLAEKIFYNVQKTERRKFSRDFGWKVKTEDAKPKDAGRYEEV
jgi:hypothetical protein